MGKLHTMAEALDIRQGLIDRLREELVDDARISYDVTALTEDIADALIKNGWIDERGA